jgi:hypothetical protein
MPIVQLMVLGLIISGFVTFMIVLMGVSIYVSIGKSEAAPTTKVTPARRPDEGVAANQAATAHEAVRRYG